MRTPSSSTLPDLTALYRDDLAVTPAPQDGHPAGLPRGWLLDVGVPRLVQPFLTSAPEDAGDLARFAGLDATTATELLDRLPAAALTDRQNDAPSLATLLRAAADNPGTVELHGYLVGPGRPDERITVEGVDLYDVDDAWDFEVRPGHGEGCECELLWSAVRSDLELDDTDVMPQELRLAVNPWRPHEVCWHLWWD